MTDVALFAPHESDHKLTDQDPEQIHMFTISLIGQKCGAPRRGGNGRPQREARTFLQLVIAARPSHL
jgi:hypothetical protein